MFDAATAHPLDHAAPSQQKTMSNPANMDTVLHAIRRFDRVGAVTSALDSLDEGSLTIPALYDGLAGFLVETGAQWQSGITEVWQEHLLTGIVRNIVEACAVRVDDRAPRERKAIVLLGAPADEYHDVGLRMLADRFTLAGWRAHFLGAALPLGEAKDAVRELAASAVALSASTHFHRLALRPYVEELTLAYPDLRVWVGGPAFAHEHDGWPDEMVLDPSSIPAPEET
jgi:methanogenic corrinoid protein MtbC1